MVTAVHVGTICSRSGDYGESTSMMYAPQTRALAGDHFSIFLPFSAECCWRYVTLCNEKVSKEQEDVRRVFLCDSIPINHSPPHCPAP